MRMVKSPDRTEFVLQQPMSSAPGVSSTKQWKSICALCLITKKTGQSAFDFAKKELFEPLGITSARGVASMPRGVTDGEAGLFPVTS